MWLGLAAAQCEYGRPEPEVLRPQALAEPPSLEAFVTMDIAEDQSRREAMIVQHDRDRPAPAGDLPPEVTFRALMLWLVHDADEDEAHERDACPGRCSRRTSSSSSASPSVRPFRAWLLRRPTRPRCGGSPG